MVALRVGPDGADYGRVQTCGSVWACPVCSARILFERTQDVAEAFRRWDETGGRVGMVTLTVRHRKGQALKDVWGLVGKAWARMTSGRPWSRVKERMNLAGWMRATEVTHGANGWHVHLHVLVFVEAGTTEADFKAGTSLLLERWSECVDAMGGYALVGVQDARLFVNPEASDLAYFAKAYYGGPDDAALEVTRSDLKTGAGRSPFEILQAAIESGTDVGADWSLWREFEKASHRKRMHTWSQGIRDRLALGVERSDDEVAADESLDGEEVQTVGWLPLQVWKRVRASDHLYYGLLDALEAGTWQAFADLHGLNVLPPGAGLNWYAFRDADGLDPSQRAALG